MSDYSYPNTRRVTYSNEDTGEAVFVPVCPSCGRYVRADDNITVVSTGLADQPNATCSKCGRIQMLFEGFY